MIFSAVEHLTHHCRLAARVRTLTTQLAKTEKDYEDLAVRYYETRGELDLYADKPNYLRALVLLEDATAKVADLEQHLECMSIDNAELEKTVEALTDSHLRRWWETGAK